MTDNTSMISTVFKTLNSEQKEQLLIAFNDGTHHVLVLDDGNFIGVNIQDETGLEIIEAHNNWYFGVKNDG
jgi:urease accessory protein UreE